MHLWYEQHTLLAACQHRYNEIAELVVAAAQRQLVRQRAEREGVVLPASAEVVKVGAGQASHQGACCFCWGTYKGLHS